MSRSVRRSLGRQGPWRYLASGTPVRVSARRRVAGSPPTSRRRQHLATALSRVVVLWVRLTRRITVRGALPTQGCVAVSYHRSYWDGPLICMLDERITAVANRTWKTAPVVGRLLDAYGVIWTDEDVVARATRYVRDGGICWLAPYGFARTGEHRRPHSGAAQIARDADAPIVCLTLTHRARRRPIPSRRTTTIRIGEPIPPTAEDTVHTLTERLVAALHAEEGSDPARTPGGQLCSSSR